MDSGGLRERKLFQWAVAYLAGSWLFLEVCGFVADRFSWPDPIVRGATILLFVGLFLVLVLAWYHGEKGRQWVSGPELLWITLVLAIGGLMLRTFAGYGEPLQRGSSELPNADHSDATRFVLPLPESETFKGPEPALALSPDGRMLAYVSGFGDSTRLYLRELDSFERRPIDGTDGARAPFFSPDGQWIGFFADGKVKKVALRGGAPHTIVEDAWIPRWDVILSGSWGPGDVLLLSYPARGIASRIWRVSAQGGTPTRLTQAPWQENHFLPQLLPDGRHVLFSVWDQKGASRVALVPLETGEPEIPLIGGSSAVYLETGHLLYLSDNDLLAAPFDLGRLAVTGAGMPVVTDVWTSEYATAHFSVSTNGTIAYLPATVHRIERTLVWVDSTGFVQSIPGSPTDAHSPRISPDGGRVMFQRRPSQSLWMLDLGRGSLQSVTDGTGKEWWHVWRPGSEQIVFNSLVDEKEWTGLYTTELGSHGTRRNLTDPTAHQQPQDWSPDGDVLIYTEGPAAATGMDIWTLRVPVSPTETPPPPEPYLITPNDEFFPDISPDGRWIAYTSDMSGRWEVYVARYDSPTKAVQVSVEGGSEPSWSPDGGMLYYRSLPRRNIARQMMEVAVRLPADSEEKAIIGAPRLLFDGPFFQCSAWGRSYDLSSDGRRFLMVYDERPATRPSQINVVVNWFAELGS